MRYQPITLRTVVLWRPDDDDHDNIDLIDGGNISEDDECPITFDWFFTAINHLFRGRCYRQKKTVRRLSFFLGFVCLAASVFLTRSVAMTLTSNLNHGMSTATNDVNLVQGPKRNAYADATRQSLLSNNVGINDNLHHEKKERLFRHNKDDKTANTKRNNIHGSQFRFGASYYSPDDIDPYHNTHKVRLPKAIDQNLANVNDPYVEDAEIPYFFHIPRSAGSTVKDILGSCIHLTTASDVGSRNGHERDPSLKIVQSDDGSNFVNVDTSTPEGIHMAKRLGLVESGLADMITTQYFHVGATLFSKTKKGRMFTFIRHPIERAVSLFYYLAIAHWEPTYDPDLAYISIEMYARSKRIEHNWMVRFLTNELERDLTPRHLDLAKEVLRQKCIIGLVDEKNESWLRLMRLFGWEAHSDDGNECLDRHLNFVWSNKHNHPVIEEGTLAWQLLYKQNELDMMLYEYAHLLFQEQAALFGEGGSLVT